MDVRRAPSLEETDGLEDVVAQVLNAFKPMEKDADEVWDFSTTQQESAGSLYWGCLVLLRFSKKHNEIVDGLGQLQPGAFATVSLLERYLLDQENYRTFAMLSEWKPVGPAVVSGSRAVQQLLVRRERSQSGVELAPANWEELRIDLELQETPSGPRWAVSSLYKDYYGPTAAYPSDSEKLDADRASPFSNTQSEEERNC